MPGGFEKKANRGNVFISSIGGFSAGDVRAYGGVSISNLVMDGDSEMTINGMPFVSSGSSILIGSGSVSGSNSSVMIQQKNGTVEVTLNGITTCYKGKNGMAIGSRVYIDDIEVSYDDPRIIRPERSSTSRVSEIFSQTNRAEENKSTPTPTEEKRSPEFYFLRDCTEETKEYLERFAGEPRSKKVEDLHLTSAELMEFKECLDFHTQKIMDKPVQLYGRVYDFSTVLGFKGYDPHDKNQFHAIDVKPSKETLRQFDVILDKIAAKQAQGAVNDERNAGYGLSL